MRAAPARAATLLALCLAVHTAAAQHEVMPPVDEGSVRFLAMGDTGTGDRRQYEVAAAMARAHATFPFTFAIMMGDNLYGSEDPEDYREKFEVPYRALLDAGVEFYASLGNHDDPNQRLYKPFNMGGERYYTFRKGNVRFFALDSGYFDRKQREWLEHALSESTEDWKICFFHHPIYSSGGRHGSDEDLRAELEPLFLKYGVQVVFAGHEHFYERLKPQKGIHYFVNGGGAKLRAGDIRTTGMTARGFDTDRSYMLVEINDDVLRFQTLSRAGRRVDVGEIHRVPDDAPEETASGERSTCTCGR